MQVKPGLSIATFYRETLEPRVLSKACKRRGGVERRGEGALPCRADASPRASLPPDLRSADLYVIPTATLGRVFGRDTGDSISKTIH
jgi:hypothetical protein